MPLTPVRLSAWAPLALGIALFLASCASCGAPPGVIASAASGPTTEAGGQATFTVVLASRPKADVVVSLSSSTRAEGIPSLTRLTFTPDNWNAPQTVTVTGVDDEYADGTQSYSITFAATTSSDPAYAGLMPASVAMTNTDDDTAGFTVRPASGPTTEARGQSSFSVVLNSQPTTNVVLNLASDQPDEGDPSPNSLTFTPANWQAPQTVFVFGVDDSIADGDQTYAIVFSIATSDPAYGPLQVPSVSLVNTDNDTSGIIANRGGTSTTEAGSQVSFTVVLRSQPTANVSLDFDSSDRTEGIPNLTSVTFTPANWNAPRTVMVTGVDDALADGNQPYNIVFSPATSTDSTYAGLAPAAISLTNTDNDSPGITVSAPSGPTTEIGGPATFTVVLNSQPTADVTVNFASDDSTEGSLVVNALTFTPVNWNAPQTVTVTGVDDALQDGNQPYAIVFAATASADPAYAPLRPANVLLTNLDNELAGFVVSAPSGPTSEAGGRATFTLVLTSQPTATVTVNFSSDDTTEGTVPSGSLTFTPTNWSTQQTVTVTGVDDLSVDGDQPYAIVFGATASTDPGYSGVRPPNVSLSNIDNDTAGISVSTASGSTSEAGGQATFTVVLNVLPTADVTVSFNSNDLTEGTVSTTSLLFTPANWSVPRAVTVTGVDDTLQDGNQPYAIVFSATTSADPAFSGLIPANVSLVNRDNDTPGINISAVSGPTTETGGQATFSVVLTSIPTANVTLSFDSNDLTEGTVNFTSLLFTAANWSLPRTVTVTGVDDALQDGNQDYAVVFAPISSADPAYAGITPASIALTNLDDEVAGFVVSAPSGSTSEGGGQATFTVVLRSQPFANVTVSFNSSDLTEGTVNVTSLTFTATDWNVPQTVTVTGVDDALLDGNQTYTVAFAATTSADPIYAALRPADVTLINTDNEGGRVLVFTDASATYADEAAMALGQTVTYTTSGTAFNTAFDAGGYNLIIWDSPNAFIPAGCETRLINWVNAGSRLIFSYWDLDATATMRAALGVSTVSYSFWRNVYAAPGSPVSFFAGLNTFPSPLTGSDTVLDNGDALTLTGTGFIAARLDSTTGPGAIAVTRANRVVVNGFLPNDVGATNNDADAKPDMQELYENEISYVLAN